MRQLKPKEWHEQFLANADKEKIIQFLRDDQERDIMRTAVDLARQCDFFADFVKLWKMRVSDLDEKLSSKHYMEHIYAERRDLYKALRRENQA